MGGGGVGMGGGGWVGGVTPCLGFQNDTQKQIYIYIYMFTIIGETEKVATFILEETPVYPTPDQPTFHLSDTHFLRGPS